MNPAEPTVLSNQKDLPVLKPRAKEAHKGDFGSAFVVGGSRGMTGAVCLTGMAALRGGAGLVRLGVPDCCLDVVASREPSYMTVPLPCDTEGRLSEAAGTPIRTWAETATVIAFGTGLGRSKTLDHLVGDLYRDLARPMVIDADALNALASRPDALSQPGGPRILTPHPKEFARLLGRPSVPREERVPAAIELAARCGMIMVVKGHGTCVTDGKVAYRNETGNPGMATGGSGDVLTGLIAALWCQGLDPLSAARLGVHLHGLAGDLAADELGQISLIASDLVRYLPRVLK